MPGLIFLSGWRNKNQMLKRELLLEVYRLNISPLYVLFDHMHSLYMTDDM